MTALDHFHTLSIGSGEAGKFICWTLSSTLNVRTAVIESTNLGGSCPNIACLPSKNFIYSAEIAHLAKKYSDSGLLKGNVEGVDMAAVLSRKQDMVKGLREMHESIFEKSGTEVIMGHGRLIGDKRVEIESKDGKKRVVTADNIVICTGSRAKIDGTPGLKEAKPMTHIDILELYEVPEHLVVLGGGYVGLEFAQAFRRFGAKVTVIERGEKILKHEDEDVSDTLIEILKNEGVHFVTSTAVSSVSGTSGHSVTLHGTRSGEPFEITGSHLLIASGRLPNTEDAGLEKAGVELTTTGHVKVNEYLQTSAPNVRIVRDILLGKQSLRSTTKRQVPYTLYTSPELAHIGLSENAARKAGVQYRLVKLPMAAFLRTRTMDAVQGFAKALVSKSDDTILGFTALGPRVGELLPVVQLAMSAGLPYICISGLIVTHPTLNEGLVSLFNNVPERS
jgi:pyruvate/2-oxoglutarate dehydrogenase complex dihydrolipoamide dehydrogenase (E3) component